MKRNRKSGSGLAVRVVSEESKQEQIFENLLELFLTILLFGGLFHSIVSMFECKGTYWIAALIGVIMVVLLNIRNDYNRFIWWGAVSVLLLFLVFVVLQQREVIQSICILNNQIAEMAGKKLGIYLTRYEITASGGEWQLCADIGLGMMAFVCSLYCAFAVKKCQRILIFFTVIPVLYLELFTDLKGNTMSELLLGIGMLILAYSSYGKMDSKGKWYGNGRRKTMVLYLLFLVIFGIAFGSLMQYAVPESGYRLPAGIHAANRGIRDFIKGIRYERKSADSYTQGDFSKLGNLKLTDTTVLEVIMEKPKSMYLKGYVGSRYTDTGWEDFDSEELYEAYSSMYWLWKEGFKSGYQLSKVSRLTGTPEDTDRDILLSIYNKNGNSQYIYTPYEWSGNERMDIAEEIWNISIKSQNFFGNRYYTLFFDEGVAEQYPLMAKRYYEILEEGIDDVFIRQEQLYKSFVYNYFCDIPQETENLIKAHLGMIPANKEEHMSYEEAYAIIADYLSGNINYDENPGTLPENTDFLQYFLETNGKGFAAHYATAAVMMYRYLGIPARYVEGYIIMPKDVEGINPMNPVSITGKNAHAWAEIYQDGIGWVPVEVTPGYVDIMNVYNFYRDKKKEPADNEGIGKQEEEQIYNPEEPERQYTRDKKENVWDRYFRYMTGLIFLIPLFVFAVILVRKRVHWIHKTAEFQRKDFNGKITAIKEYLLSLYQYDAIRMEGGSVYGLFSQLETIYGQDYAREFESVMAICQESQYSLHEMKQEQYEKTTIFLKKTLDIQLKKRNFFQRCHMKFWACLF